MRYRREGPVVLVPTERHVERARVEGVVAMRRFFDRLAAELRTELSPASGAARRLAARRALAASRTSPSLARLFEGSSAEQAALVTALDATIGTLIESGATKDDLSRTGTARGAELAGLLAHVEEELGRARLYDPRSLVGAGAIESGWAAGDRRALAVEGVTRPHGVFLEHLLAIHRGHRSVGGEGVTVRLPRFDDPDHPMSQVAALLERRLATEPDALEIEWLETAQPEIAVVEAHGPAAEARAATARVLAALEAGVAPESIAICAPPGDESILSPLRVALLEARIPFSEEGGRPAGSIPEVRAALSLLSMASRSITRDGLVELLRLPGLHAGAFVGARDEVEAATRAARLAHEIRQLSIQRDPTGEGFVEALRSGASEGIAGWAAESTARLCRAIASLRDVEALAPLARDYLDLVTRMRLGAPSAREIAFALRAQPAASLAGLGEGAIGLRLVRRATEDLVAAQGMLGGSDDRFTTDDLLTEIEHALTGARTNPAGASARAGALRLTRPGEIAGAEHALVVITRLGTSGYRPGRGSLLLDETTRRRLPERCRPPSPGERAMTAEAELAWVTRSASRLVLTFATTDDDGREAEPAHPIVTRALEAGASRSVEPASRVASSASILSQRGRELAELANGAPPTSDLLSRVAIETSRLQFFLDPGRLPGPHSGRVEEPYLKELARRFGGAAPDNAVTVVAIEAAAACPFKAFANRVLLARPLEEVSDPLSPRERGDLVHKALFAAYEAETTLPPSADLEARLAAARAAASRAIGIDEPSGPLRAEGKRRVLEEVIELLSDELAAGAELRYRYGEKRFGHGEAHPWGALALPSEDASPEPVWVEGRIDRVDLSPDGRRARVVDYKTGRTLPSMKALGETAFQLPLYARVVARQSPAELTVAYVSAAAILAGQRKRDASTPMGAEQMDRAAERAAALVRGIWSGRVPPRPAHPSACRRCAARDLCRKPAVIPPTEEEEGGQG